MDRFDICEAHAVLEWDYNRGGWLPERPSNARRKASTGVQLQRMGFKPRPSLGGFTSLTPDGQQVYIANVLKLWLPVSRAQYLEWVGCLGLPLVVALIKEYGPPALEVALTGT